jgi:hypothetical protein
MSSNSTQMIHQLRADFEKLIGLVTSVNSRPMCTTHSRVVCTTRDRMMCTTHSRVMCTT